MSSLGGFVKWNLNKTAILSVFIDFLVQQVQHDSDTQVAQFTCVIEELRSKIKEMETEHRDKVNSYFYVIFHFGIFADLQIFSRWMWLSSNTKRKSSAARHM